LGVGRPLLHPSLKALFTPTFVATTRLRGLPGLTPSVPSPPKTLLCVSHRHRTLFLASEDLPHRSTTKACLEGHTGSPACAALHTARSHVRATGMCRGVARSPQNSVKRSLLTEFEPKCSFSAVGGTLVTKLDKTTLGSIKSAPLCKAIFNSYMGAPPPPPEPPSSPSLPPVRPQHDWLRGLCCPSTSRYRTRIKQLSTVCWAASDLCDVPRAVVCLCVEQAATRCPRSSRRRWA